jgi:hypothetical protein
MFVVFYTVNLCIYVTFHILLSLWHTNGSIKCTYVCKKIIIWIHYDNICSQYKLPMPVDGRMPPPNSYFINLNKTACIIHK